MTLAPTESASPAGFGARFSPGPLLRPACALAWQFFCTGPFATRPPPWTRSARGMRKQTSLGASPSSWASWSSSGRSRRTRGGGRAALCSSSFGASGSTPTVASSPSATLPRRNGRRVVHFQHQLVRLYSLLYGCALQQVATMDDKNFELFILEGFEEGSLAFLQGSHDRCEITLQWIQRLIVESDSKQILKIAPPILSRVFNELGNGIVNLNNARKITDFPIPFHLAQMITVMLIVHSVMTPVICAATVEHLSWAAIISFVVSFCYWAVHFITIELEMPFGDDWNDLPLQDMATDFNMSLANLIDRRAQEVPKFYFELQKHAALGKKIIDFDRSLSPSTAPAKKKPRASAEKGGRKVPDLEAVDVWRSEDDSIQSGAPVAPPGAPPGAPPPAPPAPPAPVALPTKDSLPEVKAKAKAEGSKAKEAKEEKALLLPELDLKDDPDLDLLEKYLQSADFQKRLEGYLAIAVRQLERIAGKPEKPPDPVLQDREMDGPTCVWIPQCLPDEA
ncbi:unnamed protein product [Effrenium voratum]|uniref:Uncharacterized protein n=1 Tax=Effrenium voratum TaxID=2562239 RepID=A0AA36N9P3_9DINO|nr:unnamed protein product [Effrenium voratum]